MSARKIDGTIIVHCRDEFGEIFVADDGRLRSLYFEDVLQSCIRLDRPACLVQEYSQAMMSSILFKTEPRSVLLVGLGGSSLVHFLLHAFPSCTVHIVEIRQKVIGLAHDYFLLPTEQANLRIFHAPGQDFIRQQGEGCGAYDMIFVDAFDEAGPASPLLEGDFLAACRQRLGENGVFAMNLWRRQQDDFRSRYKALREAFDGNVLKLEVSEFCWNTIVFGFAGPAPVGDLLTRKLKARTLWQTHGINFPRYLKNLYWQNIR